MEPITVNENVHIAGKQYQRICRQICANLLLRCVLQVLIPVFALGRAQELCILLETYWDRMNLKVPIYFSTGLTEKVRERSVFRPSATKPEGLMESCTCRCHWTPHPLP